MIDPKGFELAVLFDLDDTLLDDRGAQDVYLGELYENHRSELPGTAAEFRLAWRRAIDRHFSRYERGEITLSEQRRARVREAFDRPEMTDAAADRIVAEFVDGYESAWRLFPDVLQVLDELRGIPLGVVTNGSSEQQMAKLRQTGILDRFEMIVISEDFGHSKPSARIFHHACVGLETEPTACTFIGDNWALDVEGARGAGLRPIWVNRFDAPMDHRGAPVPRIATLSEIVMRDDLRILTGLDRPAP